MWKYKEKGNEIRLRIELILKTKAYGKIALQDLAIHKIQFALAINI